MSSVHGAGASGLVNGSHGGFRLGRPIGKDILDERLARGEIDVEEYTRKLDILRAGEDTAESAEGFTPG
jgi:Short C-terminal domain